MIQYHIKTLLYTVWHEVSEHLPPQQVAGTEKGGGGAGAVARLMFEPRVVLFVICCVVVGISTGVLWTFQVT